MKVVFSSMPKGDVVGDMEIQVGIDGIGIVNGFVRMIISIDGIESTDSTI